MNDLRAIILAAGKGERLHPLTNKIPKCMVKLFGKSLIEWQLGTLKSCGIEDISVVTGYRGEMINFSGLHYFHNDDFETTNMVETLFCAKEKLEENVIICYGDIIFQKEILEQLIRTDENISLVIDENWEEYWKIRFKNPLDDAESLGLDENGNITDIGQKVNQINQINGQYIGLMKFQKEGINNLKNYYEKVKQESIRSNTNPINPNIPFQKSYMTDLLQGMIKEGFKIKSVPSRNGWLELDTIEDYRIYEKMYSDGTLNKFIDIGKLN